MLPAASVARCLVHDPESRVVTHDYRSVGQIVTRIAREGAIALDPPGIEPTMEDVFVSVAEPG